MAVVYQHIRKDTNEVFYVGIGKKEKRAYSKDDRNKHWKNIVNKVGYYVEIIYNDLEWSLACNMEKYLIEAYGRLDLGTGLLCNKTDGGDGALGLIQSEESRKKIIESKKGKKASEDHKRKLSEVRKGKKRSEETRKKMSDAQKGKKLGINHSDETRKKMSENSKGKNSKKVINIETGEIYNSVKEVSEILNINYGTLRGKLNGSRKNNTNFKYI